jgi:hypothetical protein
MMKILGEMESGLLICVNNTPGSLKYGTECRIGGPAKKAAGHYPSSAITNRWTTPAMGDAGTGSTLSLPAGKLQRTGLFKR